MASRRLCTVSFVNGGRTGAIQMVLSTRSIAKAKVQRSLVQAGFPGARVQDVHCTSSVNLPAPPPLRGARKRRAKKRSR